MFEQEIRREVEFQKQIIIGLKKGLENAESDTNYLFWKAEIEKHEYAIDILNGVLNCVSLTR